MDLLSMLPMDELRALDAGAMGDPCRIKRPASTTVAGVQKTTLADVAQLLDPPAGHPAGTLAGRFDARAPQIVVQAPDDQAQPRGDHTIALPYGADVQFDDRIVTLGRWFRVVWCVPVAALDTSRTVGVVAIKPEA